MRIALVAAIASLLPAAAAAKPGSATCVDRDRHAFLDATAGAALLDFSLGPSDQLAFEFDARGTVRRSAARVKPAATHGQVRFEPKQTLVCGGPGDLCRPVGPKLRRRLLTMRPPACTARLDSPMGQCPLPPEAVFALDRRVVLIGTAGSWTLAWHLTRDREIVLREAGRGVLWTPAGGVLIGTPGGAMFGPSGDKSFVVDAAGKVVSTVTSGNPIVLSPTRAVVVGTDASVVDLPSGRVVATIALGESDELLATALDDHRVAAAWKDSSGWVLVSVAVSSQGAPTIDARGTLPFCP